MPGVGLMRRLDELADRRGIQRVEIGLTVIPGIGFLGSIAEDKKRVAFFEGFAGFCGNPAKVTDGLPLDFPGKHRNDVGRPSKYFGLFHCQVMRPVAGIACDESPRRARWPAVFVV